MLDWDCPSHIFWGTPMTMETTSYGWWKRIEYVDSPGSGRQKSRPKNWMFHEPNICPWNSKFFLQNPHLPDFPSRIFLDEVPLFPWLNHVISIVFPFPMPRATAFSRPFSLAFVAARCLRAAACNNCQAWIKPGSMDRFSGSFMVCYGNYHC